MSNEVKQPKYNPAKSVMLIHPNYPQPITFISLKTAAQWLGSSLNEALGTHERNYIHPEVINFLLKTGLRLDKPGHPLHGLEVKSASPKDLITLSLQLANSQSLQPDILTTQSNLSNSETNNLSNSQTYQLTKLINSPLNSIYLVENNLHTESGRAAEYSNENLDKVFGKN